MAIRLCRKSVAACASPPEPSGMALRNSISTGRPETRGMVAGHGLPLLPQLGKNTLGHLGHQVHPRIDDLGNVIVHRRSQHHRHFG